MATIQESKANLEQALSSMLCNYLPQTTGYALQVDILENDRKKRSNASLESWRPAIGKIVITFGGPESVKRGAENSSPSVSRDGAPVSTPPRPSQEMDKPTPGVELIRALRSAEQRPGFDFVSLKWFRDLFLPAQGYHWAQNSADREIRSAVEDGILLTYKVPNPKSPAFPVTAIRLNRQHPEVVSALGDEGIAAWDFAPIDIQGEPLSATVLRERR